MATSTVKICGLSTPAALDAAIGAGASHVGFVFFDRSPRAVSPAQAGALSAPIGVGRVGVFVDADDELLADAIRGARLTAIQLHGSEDPGRVAAVRATFGLETWKALPIRTRADLERARHYRGAADRLVYDAKTPDGSALPGGMGLRFDWQLLDGFSHPLPWALSGGLDAANVGEAIRSTGARLVDVSSGVETAPGLKDIDRIVAFCQAVAAS
jgi:phosphoribosylanthranilate isomerase